jgi:multiple sugar transport system substrate-binding protein
VQPDWAVAAPRITNTATYDDPKVRCEMDKPSSAATTRMLKDQGKLFAGAPAYPFHAQVREATAPIFYDDPDRQDRPGPASTRWRRRPRPN